MEEKAAASVRKELSRIHAPDELAVVSRTAGCVQQPRLPTFKFFTSRKSARTSGHDTAILGGSLPIELSRLEHRSLHAAP